MQKNMASPSTRKVKNVIIFLGDGMGITTVTAARILKGQLNGFYGEEYNLEMDYFPYTSLTKVILGAGRKYMTPISTKDPEYPNTPQAEGIRLDGINLIDKWIETKTDEVCLSHMAFELECNTTRDPSLIDTVDKAVRILRKNPNGFFLLVEACAKWWLQDKGMHLKILCFVLTSLWKSGCSLLHGSCGRIDHGHHNGQAKHALYETITFDNSIKRAGFLTDEGDTLTVVTADHSHTLSFGGYNDRGNPILGFASYHSDLDGKPFTPLAYGNGPGWAIVNGSRENLTNIDTSYANYKQ